MKNKLFLLVYLLSMNLSQAQCPPTITDGKLHGILPTADQRVIYRDIVDCGSIAQLDLFKRARLWLMQTTDSPASLVLNDKETGELVSQETMVITLPRSETFAGGVYTLRYRLVVECANRKYRATLSQFAILESGSSRATPIEIYCQKTDQDRQLLAVALDKQVTGRLASLQEAVKTYQSF